MHIIKSKAEPATTRRKRLLEYISSYSFDLYYIKGKDMVLSDFLLRQKHNDSNPYELIPISFNMYSILQEKYYGIGNSERYLVQVRIFDLKEMLGILDLKSLGYYKIKQGILQHNLSKYYDSNWQKFCAKQFNKFINTVKKERKKR